MLLTRGLAGGDVFLFLHHGVTEARSHGGVGLGTGLVLFGMGWNVRVGLGAERKGEFRAWVCVWVPQRRREGVERRTLLLCVCCVIVMRFLGLAPITTTYGSWRGWSLVMWDAIIEMGGSLRVFWRGLSSLDGGLARVLQCLLEAVGVKNQDWDGSARYDVVGLNIRSIYSIAPLGGGADAKYILELATGRTRLGPGILIAHDPAGWDEARYLRRTIAGRGAKREVVEVFEGRSARRARRRARLREGRYALATYMQGGALDVYVSIERFRRFNGEGAAARGQLTAATRHRDRLGRGRARVMVRGTMARALVLGRGGGGCVRSRDAWGAEWVGRRYGLAGRAEGVTRAAGEGRRGGGATPVRGYSESGRGLCVSVWGFEDGRKHGQGREGRAGWGAMGSGKGRGGARLMGRRADGRAAANRCIYDSAGVPARLG